MTADNCQTCGHGRMAHLVEVPVKGRSACLRIGCPCETFVPVAAPDDEWAEDRAGHAWDAAREAAQVEATLTDAERERMVDAICEGRVRNCRGTVKNWGPAEDEAETHALLIRVLRGESEGFVRDVAPIVESILADRLAGRGHRE